MRRILVVEDEKLFAQLLCDVLSETEDRSIDWAGNGREALDYLNKNNYDLILSDLQMPSMDGPEFLRTLRSYDDKVGIIVMTAFPTKETIVELNELGIEDYLIKGECDVQSLQDIVSAYFRRQDIETLYSE